LQTRLRQSEADKDDLLAEKGHLIGELAVLQQQIALRNYQTDATSPAATSPAAATSSEDLFLSNPIDYFVNIDLSNVSLALIGAHETTYREVKAELKQYGLKRCIHVPPHSIASNSRQQIKDKISNCDLIVTVTSYVDHSVSKCVKQLKDTQMLAGECIRVSSHGKSGLVREVLQYFENPLGSSEAL
jgi:hypothetical protein